jgi:aminomethyltransferase
MAAGAQTLKRTPLYDRHVAAGARLVPFAGWEMPVQYGGIREEHLAVREGVGIFDVSHMGEVETTGPDAEAFLQRVLSNDVSKMPPAGAQYSVMCRDDGGVLDDLFTYRLADGFLTVTNAANHERDLAWMQRHTEGFDVTLRDRLHDYAMLAVQGPEARALVAPLADGELPKRFRTERLNLAGAETLVCGTGYTGEDGVELLVAPDQAVALWDAVVGAGAAPAGLGARDTLRLEVCFHLYGNDLMEERGPIEAGLGWCCKEDTGFIGADAVRAVRDAGPDEVLVPFAMTGPGIARQGNPVQGGGVVTSGTMSPCLGIGIGMAYVPAASAEPSTPLEIDVRGKLRAAEVRTKPLYTTQPTSSAGPRKER